jgi:hypothetical protein
METNKRAVGFGEFARMFSISVDSTKRLWKAGKLATITVGARRLVPFSEVERVAREGAGSPRQSQSAKRIKSRTEVKQ